MCVFRPCSFCGHPFSSSGAGSSLVGSYAPPLPLRALGGSLLRSRYWLLLLTPGLRPLHSQTHPLRPLANELLQTVLGGPEVGGARQKIPRIQLVDVCGLLAAWPSELSAETHETANFIFNIPGVMLKLLDTLINDPMTNKHLIT